MKNSKQIASAYNLRYKGRMRQIKDKTIILVAALLVGSANAQDTKEPDQLEELVVYGSFQQSLADALREKREGDTILDAVSSEDLGKLPDISIAESLARLPGVVANRDRGNATELSIRGLGPNLSLTLLNGREVATGEDSRNVRYETFPAELLNGAYVYKSTDAGRSEGGIGGVVDLRTIRPLDLNERKVVVNIRGSYNDISSGIPDADDYGYTGSISYVDQFADDTLGIAIGYSRREQPIATARTNIFPYTDSFSDIDGDGTVREGFFGDLVPFGYEALIRGGTDDRDGFVSAIQWQPNEQFSINTDLFYSTVDFIEEQRGFRVEGLPFGNSFSEVTVEDNFLTGADILQNAGFGLDVKTVNEQFTLFDDVYSGGLNLEWQNGPLTIAGDLGYSRVEREVQFVSVQTRLHDVSGATPVQLTSGVTGSFDATAEDAAALFSFGQSLDDPSTNLPFFVDLPDSDSIKDEIKSYAFDITYETGSDLIPTASFGVRMSDREKSLIARSDFPFIDESARTAIPDALLNDSLTGFGDFSALPAVLNYDREAVIDQLFGGIDPQQSNFNQTESWVVEEDITAAYVQLDLEGTMLGFDFTGNLGVRVARTETTSSSTFLQNGAETGFVEVLTPFSVSNSYTDTLPSLNLSFNVAEDQYVRFGLSKAISRAPLDDLNAGVGEFNFGFPEAFGGNPELEPFRTDQLDLTYENYFADDAAITASAFYKDVETFIVRETTSDVTLPSGAIGNFTQPVNGTGGSIKGFELAYTQPFSFLPAGFDNFGLYLNYTYVDSDIEVGPAFVAGSFPLPGLAENTVNAQLWYFKNGFEARLGYRYRDDYPVELNDVPDQILFDAAETVWDFQASYQFADNSPVGPLKILLQGNNLTDEPFQTFYASSAAQGRYESFGRRVWFGASYEF